MGIWETIFRRTIIASFRLVHYPHDRVLVVKEMPPVIHAGTLFRHYVDNVANDVSDLGAEASHLYLDQLGKVNLAGYSATATEELPRKIGRLFKDSGLFQVESEWSGRDPLTVVANLLDRGDRVVCNKHLEPGFTYPIKKTPIVMIGVFALYEHLLSVLPAAEFELLHTCMTEQLKIYERRGLPGVFAVGEAPTEAVRRAGNRAGG